MSISISVYVSISVSISVSVPVSVPVSQPQITQSLPLFNMVVPTQNQFAQAITQPNISIGQTYLMPMGPIQISTPPSTNNYTIAAI